MRRTIPHTAVALTALALALAGCGGQADSGKGGDSDSVSSSPTPTTRPSTTPTGCAPASTLGVRDSGRTVCMAVGDTIRISLDGTAKRPWKPLSPKGSVLEAANSGIVLQPGDASAAYKAVEKERPGCSPRGPCVPRRPAGSPAWVFRSGGSRWW